MNECMLQSICWNLGLAVPIMLRQRLDTAIIPIFQLHLRSFMVNLPAVLCSLHKIEAGIRFKIHMEWFDREMYKCVPLVHN